MLTSGRNDLKQRVSQKYFDRKVSLPAFCSCSKSSLNTSLAAGAATTVMMGTRYHVTPFSYCSAHSSHSYHNHSQPWLFYLLQVALCDTRYNLQSSNPILDALVWSNVGVESLHYSRIVPLFTRMERLRLRLLRCGFVPLK